MTYDMTLLDCSAGEIRKVTCVSVNNAHDLRRKFHSWHFKWLLAGADTTKADDEEVELSAWILNFFPFQVRLSRYILCYFHRVADDLEDIIHMIHFHPSSRLVEVGALRCMGYYGEVCPTWLFCAILRKKQQQSASWWVTRHPRDTSSDNWQLPVPRRPATVILTVNDVHKPAEPKIFEMKESSQILSPQCRSSDWRLAKEAPNPHWSQQPCARLGEVPFLVFHRAMGWSRFIGAVVKTQPHKTSPDVSVWMMAKEIDYTLQIHKMILHRPNQVQYMFLNHLCVFFYHQSSHGLVCEVWTSPREISREGEVTRGGIPHWISLILRLDRSEFCVDFEERYAIASKSKETNVTEGLDLYGDGETLLIIA